MKTRLEKELARSGAGTPWDGLMAILCKTAHEKGNPWRFRLRVKIALWVLPMVNRAVYEEARRLYK